MIEPWFTAVERFGPKDGENWLKYLSWSKLHQLEELISLDSLLCPPVLDKIEDHYWPHLVDNGPDLYYFADLDFLRDQLTEYSYYRVLCVVLNPIRFPKLRSAFKKFEFVGFDLVERESGVSALSNCGGWPELDNAELNTFGLLCEHKRPLE